MSGVSLNVVETSEYVCSLAKHVSINTAGIEKAAEKLSAELQTLGSTDGFDTDLHYVDGTALTVQYLLVVDALNFCFWPDGELEYHNLSKGVKAALLEDPTALSAERLAAATGADVRKLFGWPRDVPLQEERARLLREVGQALLQHFDGQAANMVAAAQHSAVALVQLVTQHMPGFRDHAVYGGRQVFLYKRAQIFAGDVYGAFRGQGLGRFDDISALTMFADYRVPVVLRVMGVLDYSPELEAQIQAKQEIAPGSAQEVEIRAATVVAVERLKAELQRLAAQRGLALPPGGQILSIHLDWWLWEQGEEARQVHPPHHRTLTVYY